MDTNGITPTYNIGGSDMGGSWIFLFAILALFGLGGNGFFGGGGNNNAIQNDINRGFDSQNLQAQTRDILGAVTSGTAQTQATSNMNSANIINSIKDGNASLIREFGNVENALTALGGNMQECCCNILRSIDGINYNNAINTATLKEAILLDGQKTRDLLTQNKIEAMQNKINQLELQQAISNIGTTAR